MSAIVLLDTSVYLNVLDVEGWNQNRDAVLAEFRTRVEARDYFLLPMATIWETGNHIAHLFDGGRRRHYAQKLVDDIRRAVNGETPYRATHFPDREEFLIWLNDFPDYAQRRKSPSKPGEGVSLADLSIIKEWEQTRVRHSMSQVLFWSLNSDLSGYNADGDTRG